LAAAKEQASRTLNYISFINGTLMWEHQADGDLSDGERFAPYTVNAMMQTVDMQGAIQG
jgi:hypothetical protein